MTKILFISHDANRAGGQIFLLNIMQYFQQKGMKMHLLLLEGGNLEADFRKVCSVSNYPKLSDFGRERLREKVLSRLGLNKFSPKKRLEMALGNLKNELLQQDFDLIYVNTIAAFWVISELDFLKMPIISHIHELEFSLQLYSSQKDRNEVFAKSQKLIACSQAVADNLIEKHHFPKEKLAVIHSFIDNSEIQKKLQLTDNQLIKEKYNLPKDIFLIGGCGNAEWRKGLDIFILVVRKALDENPNLHFLWIGIPKAGELYEKMLYDIEKLNISKNLTLIEPTPEAVELLNCLDVFTLVSREDPFPLVMLEAALAGKPIVGFEASGGCREFVENDAGFVVPYLDVDAMAEKIIELLENKPLREKLGKNAQEKVLKKFNFETSIIKIGTEITNIINLDNGKLN